jgi:hypothetical protein
VQAKAYRGVKGSYVPDLATMYTAVMCVRIHALCWLHMPADRGPRPDPCAPPPGSALLANLTPIAGSWCD